ncbi:protein-disulfide reductase, partial [Musa troglodytarum]
ILTDEQRFVQVAISSLDGKAVGLCFSASWCRPRRRFTPLLIQVYDELSSEGQCQFEIVIVPADHDEDSFDRCFSKMPWLAIPFADSNTREKLDVLFRVGGRPHLVILDASGKVLDEQGIEAVREYGAEGYPFIPEKILRLREEEEAAKKEQTLPRLLVSPARDYLISNDGSKVAVSDLEGKIVVMYFSIGTFTCCAEFAPVLAQIYRKLKEAGESFEVVLVSLDDEESSYEQELASMPWLAIPFEDKSRQKLGR